MDMGNTRLFPHTKLWIDPCGQVLADLVAGELMQLQQKAEEEEEERFQMYLDKSFNKTASLMAYSCKVVVRCTGQKLQQGCLPDGLQLQGRYQLY